MIKIRGDSVTIDTGDGNDLISLSSYDDYNVIQYAQGDGNDIVYGFNDTSTLSIPGGSYSTQVSGNNVIVTVGTNKITLAGAASLDTINIDGQEYSKTIQTLTNGNASKVTVSTTYGVADASARTKAITFVGNSLNNTIAGGAGNDTLIGGDGADTFIYAEGDGKDVIIGFANNDMLEISGTFSARYYASVDKIIFKVGATAHAITLKNFTTSTFNVNGDAYVISGSKLVKQG